MTNHDPLPRSTPEARGVSSSAISAFIEAIEQQNIELHSMMLIRHGHVIAEGWWSPYSADRIHQLYSLSKSFTSTAIGNAMKTKITLKTCLTQDISEMERAPIVTLCTEAHQVDFGPLFTFLPPDGLHVLAYDARRLVGHAVVTTRWLQPGNLPLLKTAYVDAVATDPGYQRQGIGSAVMRHLAATISEYEIACLETDRVSFYARVGWEEWRGPLAGRKETELIPTPDQKGIMILSLPNTPPLDLGSSLTIEYDGRIW